MPTPTRLQINNSVPYHYEIIESVIVKFRDFFPIDNQSKVDIFLNIKTNASFQKYIKSKYPHISFRRIPDYTHYIECTVYDKDKTKCQDPKKRYIAHEVTPGLVENPRIYFLTPLSPKNIFNANILPYSDNMNPSTVPIYIIQGGFSRRNWKLLDRILSAKHEHKFIVKVIGNTNKKLPNLLEKNKGKIIIKKGLDFTNYHKEFIDAYCILPLITKENNKNYYQNKLTSSINYASGYKLKCLLDQDLQNIYKLQNAEVYTNGDDIVESFQNTLQEFYKNTN